MKTIKKEEVITIVEEMFSSINKEQANYLNQIKSKAGSFESNGETFENFINHVRSRLSTYSTITKNLVEGFNSRVDRKMREFNKNNQS